MKNNKAFFVDVNDEKAKLYIGEEQSRMKEQAWGSWGEEETQQGDHDTGKEGIEREGAFSSALGMHGVYLLPIVEEKHTKNAKASSWEVSGVGSCTGTKPKWDYTGTTKTFYLVITHLDLECFLQQVCSKQTLIPCYQ